MVQKWAVIKKIRVAKEGPMYTHNNLHTSVSICAHTAAINVEGASVIDLISHATYIRSEKFKKGSAPNTARGNQISNSVGTGMKVQSIEQKDHQQNPPSAPAP